MKRFQLLAGLLLLLFCAGCGAPARTEPDTPPDTAVPDAPAGPETEDHVLLTLEAAVDGGRVLRLDAVGKKRPDMDQWGVREIRVYDGDTLIQTLLTQEGIDAGGVDGAVDTGYTDCWSPDQVMVVEDMNFDGSGDIGLFGWACNNTIPYYYWLWDAGAGQYRYAFTLQGAEAHPETGEVSASSKNYGGDGPEGGYFRTDYYRYDASGELALVRREVEQADGKLVTYEMTGGQWTLAQTGDAYDG